jgi:hypothetical protein
MLRLPLQRLEAMIDRPSRGGNGCGTAVVLSGFKG